MFRNEKVTALIPARMGSKRLIDKNIRILCGRSLTEWAIISGKDSKIIDEVIVSTDSEKISSLSEQCQVDRIIERPPDLSGDDTSTAEVIFHALKRIYISDASSGYIVLLQPTSPLREAAHIDEAFDLIETNAAVGAISVCRTEHPVEWMGKLPDNRFMDSLILRGNLEKRSQEFRPSYQVNGAVYIVPVGQFLKEKTLFLSSGMVAYVMDRMDSIDIDDEYDLRLAEWLLGQKEEKQPLD